MRRVSPVNLRVSGHQCLSNRIELGAALLKGRSGAGGVGVLFEAVGGVAARGGRAGVAASGA